MNITQLVELLAQQAVQKEDSEESCVRHDFRLETSQAIPLMEKVWRCARCGVRVNYQEKRWYTLGLAQAGSGQGSYVEVSSLDLERLPVETREMAWRYAQLVDEFSRQEKVMVEVLERKEQAEKDLRLMLAENGVDFDLLSEEALEFLWRQEETVRSLGGK